MFSKNWLQKLRRELASKHRRPLRVSTNRNLSSSAEICEQRTLMSANALANLTVEIEVSDEDTEGEPVEGEPVDGYLVEGQVGVANYIENWVCTEGPSDYLPNIFFRIENIPEGWHITKPTSGGINPNFDALALRGPNGESGIVFDDGSKVANCLMALPIGSGEAEDSQTDNNPIPSARCFVEADDDDAEVVSAIGDGQSPEADSLKVTSDQPDSSMSENPEVSEVGTPQNCQTESEDCDAEFSEATLLAAFCTSGWMNGF